MWGACKAKKDWKQKEETRLMQTTREVILGELTEKKANEEANKNWIQRHWTGMYITSIGVLATWAVGITAVMISKWPRYGKAVVPPEALTQIQQNTNAVQQAGANVANQERALKEVIELARDDEDKQPSSVSHL
jgi:hypothetical protein